ncbi:MAG: hypothetical protein IPL96_13605 [Holophagaceae bacterium]|nr:hypothetical protein [Holophagaceae bacterium]
MLLLTQIVFSDSPAQIPVNSMGAQLEAVLSRFEKAYKERRLGSFRNPEAKAFKV